MAQTAQSVGVRNCHGLQLRSSAAVLRHGRLSWLVPSVDRLQPAAFRIPRPSVRKAEAAMKLVKRAPIA